VAPQPSAEVTIDLARMLDRIYARADPRSRAIMAGRIPLPVHGVLDVSPEASDEAEPR